MISPSSRRGSSEAWAPPDGFLKSARRLRTRLEPVPGKEFNGWSFVLEPYPRGKDVDKGLSSVNSFSLFSGIGVKF
jgi:hypothetical protein